MDTQARNQWIYETRQMGVAFSAIAREFGVSVERARQIYLREYRLRNGTMLDGTEVPIDIVDVFRSVPISQRDSLYVRAWHCMKNNYREEGLESVDDVREWLGTFRSTRLPNLGKKSHKLLCTMFKV